IRLRGQSPLWVRVALDSSVPESKAATSRRTPKGLAWTYVLLGQSLLWVTLDLGFRNRKRRRVAALQKAWLGRSCCYVSRFVGLPLILGFRNRKRRRVAALQKAWLRGLRQ